MYVYSHVVIIGRKYRQTPSGENDYYNITSTSPSNLRLEKHPVLAELYQVANEHV